VSRRSCAIAVEPTEAIVGRSERLGSRFTHERHLVRTPALNLLGLGSAAVSTGSPTRNFPEFEARTHSGHTRTHF